MSYERKHTLEEYRELTKRYGLDDIAFLNLQFNLADIIFDLEEQITLLSAANNCYVAFVANEWESEEEYAGRMEKWCFFCKEYQGDRGDENKHKDDCLHLKALKNKNTI